MSKCGVIFVKDILLFFIAITLCSILLLPLAICSIWRLIVLIWINIRHGNAFSSFLSPLDLFFVSLETTIKFNLQPQKLISVIVILDEKLNLMDFKKTVLEHITEHKDHNGNLIYQRLQQHITKFMGYFVFKWDKNFDIHKHVQEIQTDVTEEKLIEFMKSQNDKPFPPESSLWEIILVPNYNKSEGKTLLYLRIHHVFSDGMSLLRMLEEADANNIKYKIPKATTLANVESQKHNSSICDFLRNCYSNTIGLPHCFYSEKSDKANLEGLILSNKYFQVKMEKIPLSKFKEIKIETGISFTAAITSCVSSSLGEYLTRSGKLSVKTNYLTALIVLPKVQESGSVVGNNFVSANFNLPLKEMSLENCVLACQQEINKAKASRSPRIMEFVGKTGRILPYNLFQKLFLPDVSQDQGILISNIVGPERKVRVFGKTAIDVFFGLKSCRNPWLTVSIISYAGSVQIFLSGTASVFQTQEMLNQLAETFVSELDMLFSKNANNV